MYDFKEQLKIGEVGERTLDAHFSKFYKIQAVPMELQLLGVDRIFFNPKGSRFTVEYKTDLIATTTRNFFLETQVNGKSGWLWSSVAQLVIYYVPPMAYILSLVSLRQDVQMEVIKGTPSKPVENDGYTAEGLLVPIDLIQWPIMVAVEKVGLLNA